MSQLFISNLKHCSIHSGEFSVFDDEMKPELVSNFEPFVIVN